MTEPINETERLNKMRQDFVANVSHELRTPLTVIHGYIDTLITVYQDHPELGPVFSTIREQTVRMEGLINDLLLLAKIENESAEAAFEPVELRDLLAALQQDMRHLSAGHILEWRLSSKFGILGNANELRSAFSNLVINAIRYTRPGGKITVEAGCLKTGEGFFRVTDTGIGIAKEHIPRITERFYRVDKGRSRASGGTGLGLAIVKHVLMRHGARLSIESEIGKGSVFTCILPKNRIFK